MRRAARKFSFSRAHRLRGARAYAAVFAYRCRVTGSMFQVYVKPNDTAGARLGVVVSKRLIPLAAARNYCKRLAREAFRIERAALAGIDLVVRPHAAVTPASAAAASAEIRALMHRARALCRGRATPPE